MSSVARLDWLTLRSVVEPRDGVRWHGSIGFGCFMRPDRPHLRVSCGDSPGGQFAVHLSGEKFFRAGGSWREVIEDVWGNPPAPLTCSRVDLAIERETVELARVPDAAAWLRDRMPPARYGWTQYDGAGRRGGQLSYVYQLTRNGDEGYQVGRARPLFARVYQKARGMPFRMELEFKEFGASVSAEQAMADAAIRFRAIVGVPVDLDHVDGEVLHPEPDGRSAPAKLLRQAWGLVKKSQLTKDGVIEDERSFLLFSALWRHVMGSTFRPLSRAEEERRKRREERARRRG